MNDENYLLSVATEPTGDVVYIHANLAGLNKLAQLIDDLRTKLKQGQCDHDHLHSPDWAGFDLTTTMLAQERDGGCHQVHHMKVYAWTDEWKEKHGL